MPAPHHSIFYRPDAIPDAKTNSVKAWRQIKIIQLPEITSKQAIKDSKRCPNVHNTSNAILSAYNTKDLKISISSHLVVMRHKQSHHKVDQDMPHQATVSHVSHSFLGRPTGNLSSTGLIAIQRGYQNLKGNHIKRDSAQYQSLLAARYPLGVG